MLIIKIRVDNLKFTGIHQVLTLKEKIFIANFLALNHTDPSACNAIFNGVVASPIQAQCANKPHGKALPLYFQNLLSFIKKLLFHKGIGKPKQIRI